MYLPYDRLTLWWKSSWSTGGGSVKGLMKMIYEADLRNVWEFFVAVPRSTAVWGTRVRLFRG